MRVSLWVFKTGDGLKGGSVQAQSTAVKGQKFESRRFNKMSNVLKKYTDVFERLAIEVIESDNITIEKVFDYAKIGKLLSKVNNLSEINNQLSNDYMENETDNRRWFLVLFLMKVVLDLDVLQSLCLKPPKGVKLEQWQCFMGHCNSSTDSLDSKRRSAWKATKDCQTSRWTLQRVLPKLQENLG